MSDLLMPVTPTSSASWYSHTRRSPKSSEPGTDMFVPIGTPIYAPGDGAIYGSGNTIGPATGRWVGIDLDNGMRFRCMHLSRLVTLPKRVKRGALIGYSGASGYGYEDWSHRVGMPGAHTHVTLWPTHASRFGYDRNGNPFTVDFMDYVGGSSAGGSTGEEDDMFTDQDRADLLGLKAAIFGPQSVGASKLNWSNADGGREASYGLLDIEIRTQELAAQSAARPAVTTEQVKAIADAVVAAVGKPTVTLDYAAIAKAVNDDAARRLAG